MPRTAPIAAQDAVPAGAAPQARMSRSGISRISRPLAADRRNNSARISGCVA
jgi:hypothetical protein